MPDRTVTDALVNTPARLTKNTSAASLLLSFSWQRRACLRGSAPVGVETVSESQAQE